MPNMTPQLKASFERRMQASGGSPSGGPANAKPTGDPLQGAAKEVATRAESAKPGEREMILKALIGELKKTSPESEQPQGEV